MGLAEAEDIIQRSVLIANESASRGPSRISFVPPRSRVVSQEEIDERTRREERYKRLTVIDECRRKRNVPTRYQSASLSMLDHVPSDVRPLYSSVAKAIQALQVSPAIIALIGEVGTGKTHLGCALINAFCDNALSAIYVKAGDYIRAIRDTWGVHGRSEATVEKDFLRPSLLVIDEWQVRSDTPSENICLFRLIDKRYECERATLIISNHLSSAEFDASVDARIASRMHDNGGGVIVCDWGSLRGRIHQ